MSFPYRAAYYLERAKCDDHDHELERQAMLAAKQHDLELAIAKNRNGQCGVITVFCDIGANAIRDMRFVRERMATH